MAILRFFAAILLFFVLKPSEVLACSACVQLTEYTFDKLIGKFEATLVKFDVAFPYGDKHEVYSELAKDGGSSDDLLIAEVGIKDYGERDNEQLAKRYSVVKDDYPVVKLFVKGRTEPFTFAKTRAFTVNELRAFVKEHSGIHMSLPGCLPELDKIVFKFNKANADSKKSLLKDLEGVVSKYESKEKKSTGKIYQLVMQRIIEKGESFVATETERVNKLLEGKISADKKKELNSRLSILSTFNIKNKKLMKEDL